MTRLIPTISGKTHDIGQIHPNTDMNEEERESSMLHIIIIMTQYELKTGLKNFKERVEATVTKKLAQLQVLETFAPVETTKLTKKQISEAVASLMFLKGKTK